MISNQNSKQINKRQRSHNRHQHNTDDGGQAMGEELRRTDEQIDEGSEQQ